MRIYYVFALALFSQTGVKATRVFLTLYALALDAPPIVIGLLAATVGVFPMLLSWYSGRLSDRLGARWLLVMGSACGACGLLVPYFWPGLPAIFLAVAASGFANTFSNVPMQNLVGLLSEEHERARNYSNYSLVGAVTNSAGPLLAGFLIDHTGYAATCLYLMVPLLVAVAMLVLWGATLPGGSRSTAPATGVWRQIKDPAIWRVLMASSIAQTGTDLFQFYMPVYGHEAGLSATSIGIILAMYSAAALVVRVFLPRLVAKLSGEAVLAYAFYLGAAGLVLLPFFTNPIVLALIAFVFGLGMGCGTPITMMLMFSRSENGRSGETLGLRLTADNFTRLVGPVFFGAVASAIGLPPVFWIDAVMLAVGGKLTHRGATNCSGVRR
jgi:predicted MFS family arabinose efflux permease